MPSPVRLSYVVAVHNEEAILEKTVDTLAARLASWPGSHIWLGENGSTDRSREVADRLAGVRDGVTIHSFTVKTAGLGYALEEGLTLALDAFKNATDEERDNHWVAFTAADLPFGFTDLDGLLQAQDEGFYTGIVIGSKAHPGTKIDKTLKRVIASAGYHALRVALLQMKTKDPQGTFFIHDPVGRQLVGHVRARNYFYTTELVYLAEQRDIPIREVPVTYMGEQRPSSVRLLKHGRQMASQLISLRLRGGRS